MRARQVVMTVGVGLIVGYVLFLGSAMPVSYSTGVASPTPGGPTATALPHAIGLGERTDNVNPLTGKAVEDPMVLQRRPLAIKISNAPALVRPQAGIGMADIVYEHYVEADLTRFTAVFYAESPRYVGSVRSARLVDLQIPLMMESLFAFSGANGPTLLRLNNASFAARLFTDEGEPLFFRADTIEIPHNLFADPTAIWERAALLGVNQPGDLSGLVFSEEVPPGALSSADRVLLDYGGTVAEWRFDFEKGHYLRWSDGEIHRDALTGLQITADNVVVVWTHHQDDLTIIASEWQGEINYAFELQIWTLGPVTLFRDGLRYDGWWHRWNDEHMLTFWRDDTMVERLYLRPGKTWFQMVPLTFDGLLVQAVAFP